ncbi:uncharacterized protein [Venturia canescens]|uniref:uncharacterized protein n=1 Tax=Venturia canescens TaxID=32260 RepID=UPI001C9CC557|nr:uncharacterized protein LOC122411953 [Venturia canescens]
MTVRATKDRQWLEIKTINCNHSNHPTSKVFFDTLPENRRLSPGSRTEVEKFIKMGCNLKLLQNKVIDEKKKHVTLKDFSNIRAKLKCLDDENLSKAVTLLEKDYGATVKVLEEERNFKGLFFITEDMKNSMSAWPDIVFIDGTYMLLKTRLTVMLLVVEDGNGLTEVVGVGLLANEDRPTFEWFLRTFKDANTEACSRIWSIMGDKDLLERDVLKEVFSENIENCQSSPGKTPVDPEILDILGLEVDKDKGETTCIDEDLVNMWQKLINKGLTKEEKEELLKDYKRIPALEAKKVNPEILASLAPKIAKKDSYLTEIQNLAGASLMATGMVLTLLMPYQGVKSSNTFESGHQTENDTNPGKEDFFIQRPIAEEAPLCLHGQPPKQGTIEIIPVLQEQATTLQQTKPQEQRIITPREIGITQPSKGEKPEPDRGQGIREAFLEQGVPAEALSIMRASLSRATADQYSSALNPWFKYCVDKGFDCFNPTRAAILGYLTTKYEEGASYGTLNSARSAISLVSRNKVGEDVTVRRFLRGVAKLRPPKPKYTFTWDVSIVLKYLEQLGSPEDISLVDLTYKTVMLLLLSTGHRAQTIANIRLENVRITPEGLLIHITDLIKTSAPGRCQPLLEIPFYSQNPNICVASNVIRYIEATKELRKESKNLLIALRKPHRDVSAQTISRWTKIILERSGIDMSVFSAHSTRHATTSAALSRGMDLDTIRRIAGWSEGSKTFAIFYKRPILSAESQKFALSILDVKHLRK